MLVSCSIEPPAGHVNGNWWPLQPAATRPESVVKPSETRPLDNEGLAGLATARRSIYLVAPRPSVPSRSAKLQILTLGPDARRRRLGPVAPLCLEDTLLRWLDWSHSRGCPSPSPSPPSSSPLLQLHGLQNLIHLRTG